jgi:hypothetical protein
MAAPSGRQMIHQVGDISFFVSFSSSIDAAQDLGQLREVVSTTASGSAFVEEQVGQDTIAA